MAFRLVDAVLFLNIRDATSEELRAYDDECAICRENRRFQLVEFRWSWPIWIGSSSTVQMVMRQLAATQTSLEDSSWSPFPMNASQGGTSRSARSPGSVMYPRGSGGLLVRPTSQSSNDNLVNILAMAETVQEVQPHIPDDIIFQGPHGFGFVQYVDPANAEEAKYQINGQIIMGRVNCCICRGKQEEAL